MIIKTNFYNSPHVGIFVLNNEEFAVVPKHIPIAFEKQIKESLNVDLVKTNICNANFLGIYAALNSKQILVPPQIRDDELKILKNHFDVIIVESKHNALGNLICMNDHGAICAPEIENDVNKHIKAIGARIADNSVVGSEIRATNKAFICHRDAGDKDIELIEKTLKVKGDVGTVNFGDPYVKCGLVVNSKGLLIGELTSGPELNRIEDIFIL